MCTNSLWNDSIFKLPLFVLRGFIQKLFKLFNRDAKWWWKKRWAPCFQGALKESTAQLMMAMMVVDVDGTKHGQDDDRRCRRKALVRFAPVHLLHPSSHMCVYMCTYTHSHGWRCAWLSLVPMKRARGKICVHFLNSLLASRIRKQNKERKKLQRIKDNKRSIHRSIEGGVEKFVLWETREIKSTSSVVSMSFMTRRFVDELPFTPIWSFRWMRPNGYFSWVGIKPRFHSIRDAEWSRLY